MTTTPSTSFEVKIQAREIFKSTQCLSGQDNQRRIQALICVLGHGCNYSRAFLSFLSFCLFYELNILFPM